MSTALSTALSTNSTVQIGVTCLCCIAILLKLDLLFLCLPPQEVGIGVIHACLAFPLQRLHWVYDTHIIYDSNLILRIAQQEGPYPVQPMPCRPSLNSKSRQGNMVILLAQYTLCLISTTTNASNPTCCECSAVKSIHTSAISKAAS